LSAPSASAFEAPEGIRSVIGQRLARLTPLTQDVLREASVLGLLFVFGELQRMGETRGGVLRDMRSMAERCSDVEMAPPQNAQCRGCKY
jgi:hypothetical protein